MSCSLCASLDEKVFVAEIMIHSSGLRYLDDPGVLAYPKILICLGCGFSRFNTTGAQLRLLGKGVAAPVSAAA